MKKPMARVLPGPVDRSKSAGRVNNRPNLPLVKANALAVWHEDVAELESNVFGSEGKRVEFEGAEKWNTLVKEKKELAGRLLAQYTLDYEASRGQSGDIKMLMAAQRSGTAADKVSAFSIAVAENPIANMRSLDALLGMVTSKVGKRHALSGFEALKELFISSLLPDCKLKSLFQHPINLLPESKDGYSLLLFWYWEECLKLRYEQFIAALEEASRDMLPVLKDKAVKALYVLLKCKPEQEGRLLTALVNKLGDPEGKVASNASFLLSNLLSEHPKMKSVVIEEVDSYLFRPHLGLQAKYHAINFLSHIHLTADVEGRKVAKRLIDVYLAVFKVMISLSGRDQKADKNHKVANEETPTGSSAGHFEKDSRIFSAILTGINRAFPFVSSSEVDDLVEVQTPLLFQLVHSKNFNVAVQALMLLYKLSSKNQIVSDRFFRALYSKLLLPAALNSSKAELFILLLERAMKNDVNSKRVCAFSKRILQVALQQPPQFACSCLLLLSNVLEARPPLWYMMLQNGSADEDLEHFEDIPDETDNEAPPVKAEAAAGVINGGYNPRHREPLYCNADRVSWWELEVLASHVHPSVAAMAGSLLSGAPIIYYGNPLNDLSLTAFLDKFMEKKPKRSTWHGGSQIEPARKLDIDSHLIGPEILSLAESDVRPEDVVFHKFYMNRMSSLKKPKKKKKREAAEEEELYGSGDESDDEEIDQMLDSGELSIDEDDDELVEGSDVEMDGVLAMGGLEEVEVGEEGDDDGDEALGRKKNKRKGRGGQAGASPFASLEEYEHLITSTKKQR